MRPKPRVITTPTALPPRRTLRADGQRGQALELQQRVGEARQAGRPALLRAAAGRQRERAQVLQALQRRQVAAANAARGKGDGQALQALRKGRGEGECSACVGLQLRQQFCWAHRAPGRAFQPPPPPPHLELRHVGKGSRVEDVGAVRDAQLLRTTKNMAGRQVLERARHPAGKWHSRAQTPRAAPAPRVPAAWAPAAGRWPAGRGRAWGSCASGRGPRSCGRAGGVSRGGGCSPALEKCNRLEPSLAAAQPAAQGILSDSTACPGRSREDKALDGRGAGLQPALHRAVQQAAVAAVAARRCRLLWKGQVLALVNEVDVQALQARRQGTQLSRVGAGASAPTSRQAA